MEPVLEPTIIQRLLEGGVIVVFATFVVFGIFAWVVRPLVNRKTNDANVVAQTLVEAFQKTSEEQVNLMRQQIATLERLHFETAAMHSEFSGWTTEARGCHNRTETNVTLVLEKVKSIDSKVK